MIIALIPSVFADLSVWPDRYTSEYTVGETVLISGTTNNTSPITLTVENPDGQIISVDQIDPVNGTFSADFLIYGVMWNMTGEYGVWGEQSGVVNGTIFLVTDPRPQIHEQPEYVDEMTKDPIQNSTSPVNEEMELNPIIVQLRAMIAELEAKIAELQEDKQNKNAKIAELRDKLKAKNNQAENQDAKLETKLEKKNAKIAELEDVIENKDAKIKHLKEKVDRKIANKQEKVGAMDEKMSDMKDEMRIWESTSDYRLFADGDIARHTYINENGTEVSKGWHDNGILSHHRYVDENGNVDEKTWYDNEVLKRYRYVDENGNNVIKEWISNGTLTYHNYIDENGQVTKQWHDNGIPKSHNYIDENGKVTKQWSDNGTLRIHNYIDENGNGGWKKFTFIGTLYSHVYFDGDVKVQVSYYWNSDQMLEEIRGDLVDHYEAGRWGWYEEVKRWWENGNMARHLANWNGTNTDEDGWGGYYEVDKYWYENGQIHREIITDENGDDVFVRWYENGQASQRVWNWGVWGEQIIKNYYDDGKIKNHHYYVNGTYNFESWSYHENGQIKQHVHDSGDSHATCDTILKRYYENGQLAYSSDCELQWQRWTEDGERYSGGFLTFWNSTSWSWYSR